MLTSPADAVEADTSFHRALAVAEGLLDNKDAGYRCFRIQLVGPFNSLAWALVRRPPARPVTPPWPSDWRRRPSSGSQSSSLTGIHWESLTIAMATGRPPAMRSTDDRAEQRRNCCGLVLSGLHQPSPGQNRRGAVVGTIGQSRTCRKILSQTRLRPPSWTGFETTRFRSLAARVTQRPGTRTTRQCTEPHLHLRAHGQ